MLLIQKFASVAHVVVAHLAFDATRVEFAPAADAPTLTYLVEQRSTPCWQTLRGE